MADTLSPSIEQYFRGIERQNAQRTATSTIFGAPDPDTTAEALQLGVPVGPFSAEPDTFRTKAAQHKATTTLSNAPLTSAWLNKDQANAGLAKDDLDNLTAWEKWGLLRGWAPARATERGIRRIGAAPDVMGARLDAQVLADAGKSVQEIYEEEMRRLGPNALPEHRATALQSAQVRYEAAMNLSEDEIRGIVKRGAESLVRVEDAREQIEALEMSEAAAAFRDNDLANADNGILSVLGAFAQNPIGGAAFIGETAAEFLPALLVSSGVTAVTRSPAVGAAIMGGASMATEDAATAMEFLQERGASVGSLEDAMAVLQDAELMREMSAKGLTRGVIIGLFDAVSGGIAGTKLASSVAGDMALQAMVQVAGGAGGEAAAQAATGEALDWRDIVVEGLAEFATMPVEILGVGGRALLKETARAGRGTAADTLGQVDDLAATSMVRARSVDKFQEALEAQGAGDVDIYVPAADLKEYFQAKDVPFEEALVAWGVDPDIAEDMALSGGDITIPLSTYAARISGGEDAAFFTKNARMTPDQLSDLEAAQFNDRVQDVMMRAWEDEDAARQADLEARAGDVQVRDAMREQLRAAGVAPGAADALAWLWGAFFRAVGARYGEDPLDLSRRFGVRVQGPQGEQARRRGNLDLALNTLRKTGVPVTGRSLWEFVRDEGGIQDVGGDVAAMEPKRGVVAETREEVLERTAQPNILGASTGRGIQLDEMGRKAAEAGYFPDLIEEASQGTAGESTDFAARLLEALSEDVAGRRVYPLNEGPDAALQALQDALDERGLDITASNDELVAALEGAGGGAEFNQFAGPQSETADIHALARAKDMIAGGANPEMVRRQTGWFRGVDEKWRYEISDEDAAFNPEFLPPVGEEGVEASEEPIPLGDLLVHDRLFAAYPDLKLIPVVFDSGMDANGSVDIYGTEMRLNPERFKDEAALLSTVIHEMQHLIQRREGFARGGNLEMTEGVRSALKRLASTRTDEAEVYKRRNSDIFEDAKAARDMVGYAYMFEEFQSLIRYARMETPSSVFRHIRNSTNWWYSPIIQENADLRRRARDLDYSLYALPRRGPKRNAFLSNFAYEQAQLLRAAVPADRWKMLEQDPRKTKSMVKALERESQKANAKLRPYKERETEARRATAQAKESASKSPFEIYQLLAGEVEARNTQNRAAMTEEERANTSPQSTMTVDRQWGGGKTRISDEDVIVVMQTGSISTPFIANNIDAPREMFQSAPPTDSEAFRKWFGDSKVVDADGKPLVVYHGRTGSVDGVAEFSAGPRRGYLGRPQAGAFFSANREYAESYADDSSVVSAYLSIQNPFFTDQNPSAFDADQMADLQAKGFDGLVWNDGEFGGFTEVIAFSPEQIKSVNNRGTWDGSDPRILNQEKRGSIQFPARGLQAGETVINLFEAADLSTFLHESGHFTLEAFTALASEPNAPAEMKADLAKIQAYLGGDGAAWSTEQHETWARSWEAYLLEGKAPSLELAPIFARFRQWLIRIYKDVRGLNVNLNAEIRDVMDRMIATDAEIAAARAEQSMNPLFREAPAGMSATDWATYQRMAKRTEERAQERLLKKVMAPIRREREAWYKAEKKAVLAEVTEEVNKRRAYRVINLLGNQTWFGAEEGAAIPDMQIDRDTLVDMFGEGVLPEIGRSAVGGKRALYAKGGMHPTEVAEFFGYATAQDMVTDLQNAGKMRDVIKQETEGRMVERHGDPLNDGSIEEEALAAIHSQQQAETNVAEARHIAGQIGRDTSMMRTKIYRQRARMMIGRMPVGMASKPAQFLAAERKAAREAEKAFAKVARGNDRAALGKALQAKEQQILNAMLYAESRKVEAEIGRLREKMRAYDKPTVRAKLAGGYIEQIDALLEDYDFRVRSKKAVERSESLRAFIDRMKEEGREGEIAIDPRLADEARRRHYTKMSVDEMRGLVDTIANIDHMGRFKQRLIDARKKRDYEETVETILDAVEANVKDARRTRKSATRRAAEGLRAALNTGLTADSILTVLDGLDERGPVYEAIKADIDAGQTVETKMQKELAEKLEDLFSVYSAKEKADMKKARPIPGPAHKEWTKIEILSAALNTGNDDNMQRLLSRDVPAADRLTMMELDAMLDTLDKRDWDFVQSMWDLIDSYGQEAFDVEERRTGVRPKKVEARPVKTKFGVYRGGYYPIRYDPNATPMARKDEQGGWDQFMSAGRAGKAQTKNGHLQTRANTGGGRALALDLQVAFSHLKDAVHGIALSEAVDNAYRLLNDKRIGQAMIDKGRVADIDTLNLWLKDLAQGPVRNTDWMNSLARIAKNNFTMSRLAFNMKTVALQATGLGQSAVTIGHKNMLRGIQIYLRDRSRAIDMVVQASPFMSERASTFQKDIYDFRNDVAITSPLRGKWDATKDTIAKWGFAPIVKMQFLAVDMPTWLGAYTDATSKGWDDAKAVQYADRMVARAQDSGLLGDRAGISRGTLSERTRQNDVIKLFSTLGGYMIAKMNRGYIRTQKGLKGMSEAESAAQAAAAGLSMAADLTVLYMLEGAMMALLYGLMTDDDEPEDYVPYIMSETVSAMVGGIPIVRDAANAKYGGGGIYGSITETPFRVFQQVEQGQNDKALRRAIADTIGLVTGLPTTAGLRAVEGMADGAESPAEILFGSNPLTR